MNKKKLALSALALCQITFAYAGGILTNTNQNARFIRMVALDASTQIDAAYYNPAGLVKLNDGFHFSFTNQSAFQTRTINATFPTLTGGAKEFEGKASVAIIPSLQAAYKVGDWVLSGNLAVTGGGGKATFNNGLPMFEVPVSTLPATISRLGATAGLPLSAQGYSIDGYMAGTSIIYGAQMGGTYKVSNNFSLYGGFRLNIVSNKYEGYLKNLKVGMSSQGLSSIGIPDNNGTLISPEGFLNYAIAAAEAQGNNEQVQSLNFLKLSTTADGVQLDSKQSGWGISPIIGLHFTHDKLDVGVKYEFRTGLNVENKTRRDDTGRFGDGVNTPHDIPGLLTVGASYQVLPQLLVSAGYHHFFDSEAEMASNKQDYISGGTNEYLLGLEYQIDKMFLVSAGGQITRYGVSDDYQSDLSFSLNSYSIGLGGAVNVSPKVQINVGYFWTTYSDWTKESANYNSTGIAGKDVYSRTNKVFAAGVNFSF